METIICSAVRFGNKVWRGHRHEHALQAMHDELSWEKTRKELSSLVCEQGFMTSEDRFVGRKEAFQIFVAGGNTSKSPDGFRGEELYSQDLY